MHAVFLLSLGLINMGLGFGTFLTINEGPTELVPG